MWLAKVKYEDSDEIKQRPVLIIGENLGLFLSLKMTSHTARNETDYLLKHWVQAGLKKATVVRTSKILALMENDFERKLGRLMEYDLIRIQNILLR